jgi:UDP-glucose 4-epimerase
LVLDVAIGKRPSVSVFGTDYDTPDGTCIRDYIHVTDLAGAHLLALSHLLSGGESVALNLGNGSGFSVREIIDRASQVTGCSIPAVVVGRRAGDPPELVGSSERARQLLRWVPRYAELDTIIDTAWRWHQKTYSDGGTIWPIPR